MAGVRKKAVAPKAKDEPNSETLIVTAFIHLCYETGISNVTLQKIADRAGVAFGTVRYHFAGQAANSIHEVAFKHVLASSYQRIEELLNEHRRIATFNPVHIYVETMFKWARASPHEGSYLVYMYYLSATQVPLELTAGMTVDRARLRIEALLHEAIGKGLYRPVKDSLGCAAKIHALTVGFGFIALSLRDPKQFEKQKRLCIDAIDVVIRASERPD